MADNVTLDAGSGGDSIAADDISSVKYQRVKMTLGADGVNDGDVSSANPLPITHAALTELAAAIDTELQVDIVSGSVTANAGTNLNTSALALESGGNLADVKTAVQVMDDWDNAASDGASVSGDTAHDDADAGEPVKIGAKASTALSGLTLVANNDRTNLFAGVDGVLIVRPTTGLEDIVRGNASNTDGASTQVIAASGSASIKTYLTDVTLTNTSSSMIYVELKSGTTVMYTCPVPATGGFTKTFNPPLPPNAANEAWNFDASGATTTLYCSAIGFRSKV